MTGVSQPAVVLDGGQPIAAPSDALCRRYDLALLDLDGVVYRGPHAVPAAPDALAAARAAGMRLAFVTNNASRSALQIVGQLNGLGVAAAEDEVVTSAQAAATLAAARLGVGARVFVVGGDGLRQALTAVGMVLVDRYDVQPVPEAVVQGFSPDLTYEDLAQAALVVAAGADWIATNTDSTLPTARGLQPGNGTLVAAVAAASGRQPVVAGKPERALFDEAIRRVGGTRPLLVGDRLNTDIEGAVRAGLDSLLVLTGVSTVHDLLHAPPQQRPTYLAADLSGLARQGLALTAEGRERSAWHAVHAGDAITLARATSATPGQGGQHGSGSAPGSARDAVPLVSAELDAVRVLVLACWDARDAGQAVTRVIVPSETVGPLLGLGLPEAMVVPEQRSDGAATPWREDKDRDG